MVQLHCSVNQALHSSIIPPILFSCPLAWFQSLLPTCYFALAV